MQVNSDWTMVGTAEHLEAELKDFTFRGPGVYIGKSECALVTSANEEKHPWAPLNAQSKLWCFYNYGVEYSSTILSCLSQDVPVREDRRP